MRPSTPRPGRGTRSSERTEARCTATLPAHPEPARRGGPHPGRVHPRVPRAAELPAGRQLPGLAAPHHHQPVPRRAAPGPPRVRVDTLGDDNDRIVDPVPSPADMLDAEPWIRRRGGASTHCRRTSAQRSCSATCTARPTTRSPPSSASTSERSAAGCTAAAPNSGPRWRTAHPTPGRRHPRPGSGAGRPRPPTRFTTAVTTLW